MDGRVYRKWYRRTTHRNYHRKGNPTMATIATSATPLETSGGRSSKPNEFLPVIASFNDGATRTITPDAGESLATLLDQLRAAARTIDRSVSINWIDAQGAVVKFVKGKSVPEGATAFKFMLRDLITRKPAVTEGETEGATNENVAVVTPTTPATVPPVANANKRGRK